MNYPQFFKAIEDNYNPETMIYYQNSVNEGNQYKIYCDGAGALKSALAAAFVGMVINAY